MKEDGIHKMPSRMSKRFAGARERSNRRALERRGGTAFESSKNIVSLEEESILKPADAMAEHIIKKFGTTISDRESLGTIQEYYEISSEPKYLARELLGHQRGVVHRDPSYWVVVAQAYRNLRQERSSEDED